MNYKPLLSLLIALSLASGADAQSFSHCPWRDSSIIRWVTTDDFTVFICSSEGQPETAKYYRGIDNSGNQIRLRLSSVRGEVFTAKNGAYKYILDTRNNPNATLTIVLPSGKRVVQYGNMNLD